MSEEGKKEQEANFNDAELQDIMAEIESLEQEFSEDEGSGDELQVSEALEQESDPEIGPEAEQEITQETEQEIVQEVQPVAVEEQEETHEEDSVLSFEQASSPKTYAEESATGPMSFRGEGTLNFSMNFQVGREEACVAVNSGKINVTMGDIDLIISEDGCFVEMAGGVNFSVPLNVQSQGKKAA